MNRMEIEEGIVDPLSMYLSFVLSRSVNPTFIIKPFTISSDLNPTRGHESCIAGKRRLIFGNLDTRPDASRLGSIAHVPEVSPRLEEHRYPVACIGRITESKYVSNTRIVSLHLQVVFEASGAEHHAA